MERRARKKGWADGLQRSDSKTIISLSYITNNPFHSSLLSSPQSMLTSSSIPHPTSIVGGPSGIDEVASDPSSDVLVTGIVGAAGLKPTIEAIKLGKDIALANKETLIAGGPVVVPLVEKHNVNMLPADSEHSAIFQSLQGCPPGGLAKVILTASGGAFRDLTKDELFRMCEDSPEAVLAKATTHPNWDMGAKITLDSATMCNKGLEVRDGITEGETNGGCKVDCNATHLQYYN